MPARAVLVLLACACARGSLLTGKEFLCKDPDTGALHAVNSTWRSTTFCGNYTCKLRPVSSDADDGSTASKIIVDLTEPQARAHNDTPLNNQENYAQTFGLTNILSDLNEDNDRLLNTTEIQKITELLHLVKKSDIQAVIELYNVAQEIYKGMKVNMNDIKDSYEDYDPNKSARNPESKLEDPTRPVNSKTSYWYEPAVNGYKKDGDMKPVGSEYIPTTTTYTERQHNELPYFYTPRNPHYTSYFSGTLLNNNDFGRLGYYNPQANQQSLSWYYQQRNNHDASRSSQNTPCSPSPCPRAYQYQTHTPVNSWPRTDYYPRQNPVNTLLQQYPSSSYNYSTYAYNNYNNYYKGNPWAYYDYYRNLPYQTTAHIQNPPAVVNAEIFANKGEHQETDEEANENRAKKDERSWKTDPLSEADINEIRANIAERGKLLNLPLKKRIKLERASKVIKLEQFKNRIARSVSASTEIDGKETIPKISEKQEMKKDNHTNPEVVDLETYVEKVTCETSNEPGFFSIGDITLPYPECCPQKIEDKHR